ncbi:hypothetical protein B0T14DRAFT_328314 [Immersiella caudata]|uniref:Uncharacterized protein n=1 Tax=Immersiella caudata TaxID=314043 RepID=A0AA39U473_9PEZI|nr:hypothetical protein B0T14DRAFT_328314 [Immersiella caudata]
MVLCAARADRHLRLSCMGLVFLFFGSTCSISSHYHIIVISDDLGGYLSFQSFCALCGTIDLAFFNTIPTGLISALNFILHSLLWSRSFRLPSHVLLGRAAENWPQHGINKPAYRLEEPASSTGKRVSQLNRLNYWPLGN